MNRPYAIRRARSRDYSSEGTNVLQRSTDEAPSRRSAIRRTVEVEPSAPRAAPSYAGTNLFATDPVLTAALEPALDEPAEEELKALGAYWGSSEAQEVARIASAARPTLRPFDMDGNRIDHVEVHPAYHALLNRSVATGLLSSAWEDGDDRRNHRLRAGALFLTAQCERGHLVPVSATHAAVAALAFASDLEGELYPLIASRRYDRRAIPVAEKKGVTVALALAERAAGTDRSAVAMRGEIGGGDSIRVSGMKPFVCAPVADYTLVLARTGEGPTAAMIPTHARENAGALRIGALRDVLGLASQAVACLTYDHAAGRVLGEPGRGLTVLRDVRTLLQLDGTIVAAGAMRGAVSRAVHHARYREAFGRPLAAHGLHARLLADLALESAAQTALALRLASAFDQAFERDGDHAVARIVTPAARMLSAVVGPALVREAANAIGASAVVADHPVARAEADLCASAQWDGSLGEAALELAAMVDRDPAVLREACQELGADLGSANDDLVEDVIELGERAAQDVALARAFAEQLAMIAAASALRRSQPRVVADAYVASRLRERYRPGFGGLDGRFDAAAILDFIAPED